MQRFTINDAVFVLPKFSHLYPGHSAVVIKVEADPSRPMLSQYTVQFADSSRARLFEFQVIEDRSDYQTLTANLAFDSRESTATQTRGLASGRQMILQAPGFDIDMRIYDAESRTSIMGQVLETATTTFLKNLEVRLMKESMPITTTISGDNGVFVFNDVRRRGSLNILVAVPQYFCRILGAFAI